VASAGVVGRRVKPGTVVFTVRDLIYSGVKSSLSWKIWKELNVKESGS